MSLKAYKEKRTFHRTPEPTGGKPATESLQFVVQKHQASHLHYDFRLEVKGVLLSWAVPKGPSMNPEDRRLASHVEDHPFDYKNFEGIIPQGNYGAGTVIIWDEGVFEPLEKKETKKENEKELLKQFHSGKMSIVLKGKKLKGAFYLVKTPERGENAWLLTKANDRYALKTDVLKKDKSVVSGLTLEQMSVNQNAEEWQSNRTSSGELKTTQSKLARKKKTKDKADVIIDLPAPKEDYKSIVERVKRSFKKKASEIPRSIEPMYATLLREPFNDPDWEFEIKWDGYRTIAYVQGTKVSLRSRSNQNFDVYEPVVNALKQWGVDAVLDGEIVVLNEEGKADFSALQSWRKQKDGLLVYYVYDILWLDGIDLRNETLSKRKEVLKKILPPGNVIRFSDSIDELGQEFFDIAQKNGLEGIVAKHKSSKYEAGKRSKEWYKILTSQKQEFVIGGWTESSKGRKFKSILFGYYDDEGKLIYFGHAGHGFKEKEMSEMLQKFQELEIKESPFDNEIDREESVHFMKPELVGVFEYKTTTSGGKIRHPAVFQGFREDKSPKEVVLEKEQSREKDQAPVPDPADVNNELFSEEESNWKIIEKQEITSTTNYSFEGKEVTLTNIEKPLWGAFTKAHLLMYYHAVYPFIIDHLKDRPLSLHIKHITPTAPGFYIKDMEGHQPEWAEIFSVIRKHKKKGKKNIIDYLLCQDEAALHYIINLGCIDVNPWTSRISSPKEPDYIIIDLDPSDDDFKKAIETAKAAKQYFDSHGLTAFAKTSGKTGIHLYIPCEGFTFPDVRQIAENICSGIHAMLPDITTTEVSINLRGNKLYIDPNQNDFADTVAAPYSVRPFHTPSVSTPIEWKELNSKLDPAKFNINTVMERLQKKGDLFREVLLQKHRVSNKKILKQLL